ncbi:hypothetical protein HOLleu_03327 [Holothuria leucospilota]|uniref:Uncharacterized protein n=1 Tax=Holothuria leucospilota TaxID=206669 RepID=A0A9Q1CTB7_HOLLE|nr:hypothetical protein HOLleu_03327 [Holothuria leucospilota]
MQYFRNHFGYLDAQEVYLGKDQSNKDCYYHYVPLKDTIKSLFQDNLVRAQFDCQPTKQPYSFCDFDDGECVKNNTFFTSEETLKILLFQDAFEIANPLGSARTKHKILAVYFSLGNLYPHNRSKIDQIQLVMLCCDRYIKSFGANAIFDKLVDELQEIEKYGIDIGYETPIKGGLVLISGDNLGSHGLGGFVENFSACQYICRYCEVKKEEIHENVLALGILRTKESYAQCLLELEQSEGLHVRGVKFNSPFNRLQNFHVCGPGLPPCIAHDLFEGVIASDLHLFLKYLIQNEKWFTLDTLNQRILTFHYLDTDRNDKPSKVSLTSKKLSGHAFQNWNFLRLLPLIIGDMIQNYDHEVWQLILILKEITCMVCCQSVTSSQLEYLQELVKLYLTTFVATFPEHQIKLYQASLYVALCLSV